MKRIFLALVAGAVVSQAAVLVGDSSRGAALFKSQNCETCHSVGKPQPDGKPPVGLPSNVDFGIGDESHVLYITVDVSLYRIRLNAEGFHIPWAK